MTTRFSARLLLPCLGILALIAGCASDDNSIAADREELMEGVKDAAKPVGAMLKGESDFDADVLQASLAVFSDAADKLGGLVPEGSEGGEASPAIWEDPAGFSAEIEKWQVATAAAIAAAPQSLEEAAPIVKPVMGACKSCHDGYKVDD
jgi:cytochrome c556